MRTLFPPGFPRGVTACACAALLAGCAGTAVHSPSTTGLSEQEHNYVRALAHYAQGLIDEDLQGRRSESALTHYQAALDLDPTQHRLYAKVATSSLLRNEPDRALAALEESCRRHPDSYLARVDLATAYQFVDNSDKAIEAFEAATHIAPSQTAAFATLANLYFETHRDSDALAVLARGLKTADEPEQLRAFCYGMGMRFIDAGESPRSLPCFEFVVRHADTDRAKVYYLIAQLYEGMGMRAEAVRTYELATHEDPPLPQPYIKLALLRMDDDFDGAIEVLRDGRGRLPDDMLIPFTEGQLLSSRRRFEEAATAYKAIADLMDRSPNLSMPPSYYLLYGSALERTGRFEEAETIFGDGLGAHPGTPEILNYLAYMWAERGIKLERAMDYVARALVAEPDNGAYLDTRGWILYKQGRYEDALRDVAAALKLIPGDPTVADHLGDIWSMLGDRDRAVEHWKASYAQDSENLTLARKLRANGVDPHSIPRAESAALDVPPAVQ